jgi:hypothetical protein
VKRIALKINAQKDKDLAYAKEVLDVAVAGCHAATISSSIMRMLIAHTTTDTSIAGFERDWVRTYGEETLLSRLKK